MRSCAAARKSSREPSERLSSLMGAKARARAQIDEQQGSTGTAASTAAMLRMRQSDQTAGAGTAGDQPRYAPPSAPEVASKKPEEEGTLAGRLLQRRKEREP